MAQSRRLKLPKEPIHDDNLFLFLRVIDETLKNPQEDDDCFFLLDLRDRYLRKIREVVCCSKK